MGQKTVPFIKQMLAHAPKSSQPPKQASIGQATDSDGHHQLHRRSNNDPAYRESVPVHQRGGSPSSIHAAGIPAPSSSPMRNSLVACLAEPKVASPKKPSKQKACARSMVPLKSDLLQTTRSGRPGLHVGMHSSLSQSHDSGRALRQTRSCGHAVSHGTSRKALPLHVQACRPAAEPESTDAIWHSNTSPDNGDDDLRGPRSPQLSEDRSTSPLGRGLLCNNPSERSQQLPPLQTSLQHRLLSARLLADALAAPQQHHTPTLAAYAARRRLPATPGRRALSSSAASPPASPSQGGSPDGRFMHPQPMTTYNPRASRSPQMQRYLAERCATQDEGLTAQRAPPLPRPRPKLKRETEGGSSSTAASASPSPERAPQQLLDNDLREWATPDVDHSGLSQSCCAATPLGCARAVHVPVADALAGTAADYGSSAVGKLHNFAPALSHRPHAAASVRLPTEFATAYEPEEDSRCRVPLDQKQFCVAGSSIEAEHQHESPAAATDATSGSAADDLALMSNVDCQGHGHELMPGLSARGGTASTGTPKVDACAGDHLTRGPPGSLHHHISVCVSTRRKDTLQHDGVRFDATHRNASRGAGSLKVRERLLHMHCGPACATFKHFSNCCDIECTLNSQNCNI
jgi:hypothetical protein